MLVRLVLSALICLTARAVMEILERFRPDLDANVIEPLPGRSSLMSIRKAREAFGYEPKYYLDEP